MTTNLEILNACLGAVNEAPVTTYSSNHPTALAARALIDGHIQELNTRGWWFNTEYGMVLSQDTSGEVVVPSDTLEVYTHNPYTHLLKRGSRLYDPTEHTYTIGADITVDIILNLPVEDMPAIAGQFLMKKSAYTFYVDDDGDEGKATRLEREMAQVWQQLQSKELQQHNINSKNKLTAASLLGGFSGRSINPIQGWR